MSKREREEPRILAAAERQMRAWSLAQEIVDQGVGSLGQDVSHTLGEYITISREAGAGGSEIGAALGDRLGWEVLDKNLLDLVAERFHLSRPMLEMVDETQSNWAYDVLGPWLDHQIITHEKYMVHLARIVVAAARRGNVVLVGRGGQFLLPRDRGLAVRIIASEKYRVRRHMEKCAIKEDQARKLLTELDRGRREFVSKFFHRDLSDPHLYDLVIDVEFLGPEASVDAIVSAYCSSRANVRSEKPTLPEDLGVASASQEMRPTTDLALRQEFPGVVKSVGEDTVTIEFEVQGDIEIRTFRKYEIRSHSPLCRGDVVRAVSTLELPSRTGVGVSEGDLKELAEAERRERAVRERTG